MRVKSLQKIIYLRSKYYVARGYRRAKTMKLIYVSTIINFNQVTFMP